MFHITAVHTTTEASSFSALTANIDLISHEANDTGGAFFVFAHTTNDALAVSFPFSTPSAQLKLDASTSNAPVTANLNANYQGTFDLQTSPSSPVVVSLDQNERDPEGLGRKHVLEVKHKVRGAMSGIVSWGRNDDAKQLSRTRVTTTHGPASLVVL